MISCVDISKHSPDVVVVNFSAGGAPIGRIKMEVFADVVPKTAENFRQFCTGEFRFVICT